MQENFGGERGGGGIEKKAMPSFWNHGKELGEVLPHCHRCHFNLFFIYLIALVCLFLIVFP